MKYYTVVLLDTDSCELARHEDIATLYLAKLDAKDLLHDPEYVKSDPVKVEVRDEAGECLWDDYLREV